MATAAATPIRRSTVASSLRQYSDNYVSSDSQRRQASFYQLQARPITPSVLPNHSRKREQDVIQISSRRSLRQWPYEKYQGSMQRCKVAADISVKASIFANRTSQQWLVDVNLFVDIGMKHY